MEASTLRESLVYMAENCPNRIGLNDSRDRNSIFMSDSSLVDKIKEEKLQRLEQRLNS